MTPKITAPKSAQTLVREITAPIDSTLVFTLPSTSDSTSLVVKPHVVKEPRCYLVIASCETRRRAENILPKVANPDSGYWSVMAATACT